MELKDKRTVERAMTQAENLMKLLNHGQPPTYHRMDVFFASGMKPLWNFKQILADAMLSLGLVKGALDCYINLHLWEDVIVCYTILDLRHKVHVIKNVQKLYNFSISFILTFFRLILLTGS